MNWKNLYEEIRIGDKVKCVNPDNEPYKSGSFGYGWEEGFEFKVTNITGSTPTRIYWKGVGDNGVFGKYVKKIG